MSDLSKNQQSIDTSGAHVDGGDVEALRAKFEQRMLDDGWSAGELDWKGNHYAYPGIQDAWELYQAGHAAAAETAAAVAKEREPQMPEGWAFYSADFSSNAADAFKPGSVLLTRTGRNRAAWLAMSEEDQEVNALYASGRGFTLDEAVRAAIHCVDAIRAGEKGEPS